MRPCVGAVYNVSRFSRIAGSVSALRSSASSLEKPGCAAEGPQVMSDGISEGFQFLVGGCQFCVAILQFQVQASDLFRRALRFVTSRMALETSVPSGVSSD